MSEPTPNPPGSGTDPESNGDRTVTRAGPARPPGAPVLGHYALVQKLGEGGMGAVYLAEDTKLKRRVAIKLMRAELAAQPADRERFVREARAAAAVESDYIVPIWHIGETADGTPFLAMPVLRGETLGARLAREPVAPAELVAAVARDVARALRAAHAKGLVHRDIKPNNVWLEGDPAAADPAERVARCKLFDFGLARPADPGADQITSLGSVVGTPAYMSPEQARGEPVDARSDLFALGATLFRAATGRQPFEGENANAVMIAVATAPAPPVREPAPHLPPALADLIDALLRKAPADRPPSADAVLAALAPLEPAGAPPRPAPARPDWRVLGPLVAVAVAALVLGAVVLPRARAPRAPADPAPAVAPGPAGDAFTGALGLKFVRVPKGENWFGGGGGQRGDERVRFAADFYLGALEVTRAQWRELTGDDPSRFRRDGPHAERLKGVPDDELGRFPADAVSLVAARAFVARLNAAHPVPGWEYRVPTLAQWDYACRGGPLPGADPTFHFYLDRPANDPGAGANLRGAGLGRPRPVGSYAPNPLGLFDMHGNVAEVCDLGLDTAFYKGGGYDDLPEHARAGYHTTGAPADVFDGVGLRVALVPRAAQ